MTHPLLFAGSVVLGGAMTALGWWLKEKQERKPGTTGFAPPILRSGLASAAGIQLLIVSGLILAIVFGGILWFT